MTSKLIALSASASCLIIGLGIGIYSKFPVVDQLTLINASACPCNFESYLDEHWDSVCAVAPYTLSGFANDGINRQPVTSAQDWLWTLAFYDGTRRVKSFEIKRHNLELDSAAGAMCVMRDKARSRIEQGKFVLFSKDRA